MVGRRATDVIRTLQELIAPCRVEFLGAEWNPIGTSEDLVKTIAFKTRIHEDLLTRRRKLSDFSIAQRMSWAADRRTSRIEDQAYCLLGVFNVNMPLLYGERHKAFQRLQEEIIKYTTDQSIFAWNPKSAKDQAPGDLLASTPADFAQSGGVQRLAEHYTQEPFGLDNRGLQGSFYVLESEDGLLAAVLGCMENGKRVALNVAGLSPERSIHDHLPSRVKIPGGGMENPTFGAPRDLDIEVREEKDFAVAVARYDRTCGPRH